jgi:hypothetical protein
VDIESVGVTNTTARLARGGVADFQPCALFLQGQSSNPESIDIQGRTYHPRWRLDEITILTSDGP